MNTNDNIKQLVIEWRQLCALRDALNEAIDRLELAFDEYDVHYNHILQGDNPECLLRLGDGYTSPPIVGKFPYKECLQRAHDHLIKLFGEITSEQWGKTQPAFTHAYTGINYRQFTTAVITPLVYLSIKDIGLSDEKGRAINDQNMG